MHRLGSHGRLLLSRDPSQTYVPNMSPYDQQGVRPEDFSGYLVSVGVSPPSTPNSTSCLPDAGENYVFFLKI